MTIIPSRDHRNGYQGILPTKNVHSVVLAIMAMAIPSSMVAEEG